VCRWLDLGSCEDGEDLRALPRTIDPLKALICVNLPPIRVELGFYFMRDRNGELEMDGSRCCVIAEAIMIL
jgi:hypothetical protein